MVSRTYDFTGIIQGVGFRPCICRLAQHHAISGWVQNRSGSVRAEFIGQPETIDTLLTDLQADPPPLARIDSVSLISESDTADAHNSFKILEGLSEDSRNIMIPADVAMCPDCMKELSDPEDRRYRYPFTTCVNCGPRYTVITGMPYERHSTTMVEFPLCPECEEEYTDHANRRFYAETTCCPACGPALSLLHKVAPANGLTSAHIPGRNPTAMRTSRSTMQHDLLFGWAPMSLSEPSASCNEALQEARKALADGKIVAVKGIGGFLLAIDPRNKNALSTLRERKHRPHKPLAVMARSIELVKQNFNIAEEEEKLLSSPQAPIVVINTRPGDDPGFDLKAITPDTATLGLMLPTSPLHMLLLEAGPDDPTQSFDYIVMTSGNRHSEPICLTSDEAIERLDGIADLILTHNRDIALRNDDSLCIVNGSGPQVWRRARGFAPAPVALKTPLSRNILAMGAEIKNTLAIGYDSEVVLSPHIGDLETPEAIEHMNLVAEALPAFLGKDIEAVAVDLNPDMHSSVAGRRIAAKRGIPIVEVQHHEAHALACLAENGLDSGFALAFDGTGWGRDNTIWGAELFHVDNGVCTRLAAYRPAPLPGGDKAVQNPVRQLIGRLAQYECNIDDELLALLGLTSEEAAIWTQQVKQSLNCPLSSGAGRLFDSVAVLLGCAPHHTTYEGQPAIRLEALARTHAGAPTKDIMFTTKQQDGLLQIDWAPFFSNLNQANAIRRNAADYALSFHTAVIDSAITMIEYGRSQYPGNTVALSGGVMMNQIIHNGLTERLPRMGLRPLTHSLTPPNDGCISLGQVVQADRVLRRN